MTESSNEYDDASDSVILSEAGGDLSPLRMAVIEAHELSEELAAVGFDETARNTIVAHMLSDMLLGGTVAAFIEYDEEDENEDDNPDERNY